MEIRGKEVSGDISITNPFGQVASMPARSIGGTNNTVLINMYHIHKGVGPPEFPKVDSTAFAEYATNTYDGVSGTTPPWSTPSSPPTPAPRPIR